MLCVDVQDGRFERKFTVSAAEENQTKMQIISFQWLTGDEAVHRNVFNLLGANCKRNFQIWHPNGQH